VDFFLKRHDLSGLDALQQQNRVAWLIKEDVSTPFDLSCDVMVRATHLQLSPSGDEGVLLFNMHHIASDGWSMGILIKEFAVEYEAAVAGKNSPLPELAIQYADYAYWQRAWLHGEVLEQQLNYWIKQLDSMPTVHKLPLANIRSEIKQHTGQIVSIQIDKATSESLQQLATAHQLTPFMLFHAALALVLSRHSNSHDIVIGTPVANRTYAELEALIGFFVNTLVLRVNTDYQTISDYLAHVRQINIDAQAHQDIPFEQLVEHCSGRRSSQHSPLFQIMFSMNTNERESLELPDVSFSAYNRGGIFNKFDLDIKAAISDAGLTFNWVYDVALFSHEYITSLGDHLSRVLSTIADNRVIALKEIPMLAEREVYHLTQALNNTNVAYPADKLIHELFEQQAALHPNNIALVFEDNTLTYQELNTASNQLAHYLREQGVTTETLVGICVEHSLEMVVGILAVLKAGGAYVPFDPNYPQARLHYMLIDTQVKYIISQEAVVQKLGFVDEAQVILIDDAQQQDEICQYSETNPVKWIQQNSKNLAYVIYTSGSTGKPKGVMIEHCSLVNFGLSFKAQLSDLQVDSGKWLWSASYSFDASLKSIVSLWLGATVFLLSRKQQKSPQEIAVLLNTHQIPVYNSTPTMVLEVLSALQLQNNHFPSVIVSGEELTHAQLDKLMEYCQANERRAINAYGPTETCVNSSFQLLSNGVNAIGKCIFNTQAYLLDNALQLVPFGAVGELHIAGAGLARGYLNRPELTCERFIQNPFSDEFGSRLYKTGDLARYRADGSLEFVGRNDEQVKVRGFRIELREIENVLSQCHGVASNVVIVKGEAATQRLIGYVTTDEKYDNDTNSFIAALMVQLQAKLPDYMVPSSLLVLEALPLTLNGKIDKKALPEPNGHTLHGEYVAPTTATEKALLNIWSKLLDIKVSNLSVKADFFSVGGHSLLAIRLMSEIRRVLKLEVFINYLSIQPFSRLPKG
jgi:amino acid adenylation domain-containing protein